ncbi:MAG: hypothetical protein ACJ71E_10250 [Nitrososphaeraceae archaeon]
MITNPRKLFPTQRRPDIPLPNSSRNAISDNDFLCLGKNAFWLKLSGNIS